MRFVPQLTTLALCDILCLKKFKHTGCEKMTASKIVKSILLGATHVNNLFWALVLYWCGLGERMMIGIFAIIFYRLSLWTAPFLVSAICWLPLRPKVAAYKRLLMNLVCLAVCGAQFVICFALFGNWF